MKKILGAHNANTYLRPRKWWMRLINFTSKCQKLSIEEQFEHGVRYFDFRIRYNKKYEWVFCHGPIEYKREDDIFYLLIKKISKFVFTNKDEKIYIRFIYDDTFNNHTVLYDVLKPYLKFVINYFNIYSKGNVICLDVIRKTDWSVMIKGNESNLSLVDCFRNYRNYKWIPFPQRYISKHKERYQEIIDNTNVEKDTVFLCDRVDLFKIK